MHMLIDLWYRLFPNSFFKEIKVDMYGKNYGLFKYGKLKNGIRVLMLNPKDIGKSESINVSVGGGCGDDPVGVPGLAHLLEHAILSIDSNNFDYEPKKFVEWSGGNLCATTTFDSTDFSLDVQNDLARKAYDILASMFQKPEIDKKIIDYAIKSIDLEYYFTANLATSWSFAYLIANHNSKTHNAFSCGNFEFFDCPGIYDLVNNLYRSNYVAENMVIVVISSRSFDDQLRSIRGFLNVPKRKIDPKNDSNNEINKKSKNENSSAKQRMIDKKKQVSTTSKQKNSQKRRIRTNSKIINLKESKNSVFAFSADKKGWIVLTDQTKMGFTLIIEIPRIPQYIKVNPQKAFFKIVHSTLKHVLISQNFECTFEMNMSGRPKSIEFEFHFYLNPDELKNYQKIIDFIYQYLNQLEITPELYKLISDDSAKDPVIQTPKQFCANIHFLPIEFAHIKDYYLLSYSENVISKFLKDIREYRNWIIIVNSESLASSCGSLTKNLPSDLKILSVSEQNSIMSFERYFGSPEKYVVFYEESNSPTKNQKNKTTNHFYRTISRAQIFRTNPGNCAYVLHEKISPKPFPEKIQIPKILPRPIKTVKSRNLKKNAEKDCNLRSGILQKKLSFKSGTIFFIFDDESYPSSVKIQITIKSDEIRKNASKIAAFIFKKSIGSKIKAKIDHKTFDIILKIKSDAEKIVNEILDFFENLKRDNSEKNDLDALFKEFHVLYAFDEEVTSLPVLAHFDNYAELFSGISKDLFLENSVEFPSYYFADIIVVGDLELSDVTRLKKIFCVTRKDFTEKTSVDTKNVSQTLKDKWIALQSSLKNFFVKREDSDFIDTTVLQASKNKLVALQKNLPTFKFRSYKLVKILGYGCKNFIVSILLQRFLNPLIYKVLRVDLRLAYTPDSTAIHKSGQSYWCFNFFTDLDKEKAILRIEETIKYAIKILKNMPVDEFQTYLKNTSIIDKKYSIWTIARFYFDFDAFENGLLEMEKEILQKMIPQDLIGALESKENILIYEME